MLRDGKTVMTMAESHAHDSRRSHANAELRRHIDKYLTDRGETSNHALEYALGLASEKLEDENSMIVRRWD